MISPLATIDPAVAPRWPAGQRCEPAPYIERLISLLGEGGSKTVLRHRDADISAEQLLTLIFRYARALRSVAIGPGTLVALFASNHPDALAIRYAANLIGAATAFLSRPNSEAARATLLDRIAPDLLVVFPETAACVPLAAKVPVVAVGEDDDSSASLRLDTFAAAQSDMPVACEARADELAIVLSSGGSTGVPKASWRTFAAYTAMVDLPSPPDRCQLINGPLAYLSQVLVDATLLGGGCVVLQDAFDPVETLAAIERERITDLFLVEPQLFELMDHPDLPKHDFSSLRSLTHIGASAPPTLRRRARARLGPVLAHTYGASEMGLVSLLPPHDDDLLDPTASISAGRILATVEVRFRRHDGGVVDPLEGGSIEARSPAMAGGYLRQPDLEAAVFHGGWYRSGDLGRLDAGGRLHVVGRAVDVLQVDGVCLTPVMIEDVLCQTPSVRYAVVVADPGTGTWTAAVETWPDIPFDVAACSRDVGAVLGSMAASRLLVVPVVRVPRTEQGKPDREAIRRLGDPASVET